jgi:hypothetical protein
LAVLQVEEAQERPGKAPGAPKTVYKVTSGQGDVWRRFSEFDILRKVLLRTHAGASIKGLPFPKKGRAWRGKAVVESRRAALNSWIGAALALAENDILRAFLSCAPIVGLLISPHQAPY